MSRRKFSDKQIRDMYKHAAHKKISLWQACRGKGLSNNDYAIVRNWGKQMGLTPLTPTELSGQINRDCQLYALIVDGRGIYIGSSADPELRFKQHIQKAKRDGKKGVNKRDRFMFKAMQEREDCFSFKVFPKKYKATEIAHHEPRLISKVQAAFPDAVHLNSLVGAPMGGYGVKLSDDEIQAVIDDYTSHRITTEKLAEKYGVGRGTINRILQRAGATKPRAEMIIRYDDTVRKNVVEDIKAGATDNQITEKYGMGKRTVYLLKKEYGLIKYTVRKMTNIKVRDMVFPTLKDACNYFGAVDYKTAHRRIKQLKWSPEEALTIKCVNGNNHALRSN
jgi:transposase